MLPFGKSSLVTGEPSGPNLYVILTGKGLYSSTINEETEKRGDSIADYKAVPRATVSREFKVLKHSVLPNICFEMSKMIGVLVASPIISTEWI
jgi:hypothetical protein